MLVVVGWGCWVNGFWVLDHVITRCFGSFCLGGEQEGWLKQFGDDLVAFYITESFIALANLNSEFCRSINHTAVYGGSR